MNGFYCLGFKKYGILVFESMDEDKMDRSMQPVYMRRKGSDENNKLNSFMDKCWDGFYTCQKRLSRFVAIIDGDAHDYEIVYTGSVAKKMKYRLQGLPGVSTTISVHYTNPKVYSLYDSNNKYVPMNDYDKSSKRLKDIEGKFCGENTYVAVKNYLNFHIKSGCELNIKPRNVVMAMVRLEWSFDQFFSDGGATTFADRLAGALGIHASTIKVVGVYKGSSIIDYEVGVEEVEVTEGDDTTAEEIEKMNL